MHLDPHHRVVRPQNLGEPEVREQGAHGDQLVPLVVLLHFVQVVGVQIFRIELRAFRAFQLIVGVR